jgi:hypothetical protein
MRHRMETHETDECCAFIEYGVYFSYSRLCAITVGQALRMKGTLSKYNVDGLWITTYKPLVLIIRENRARPFLSLLRTTVEAPSSFER